MALLTIVNKQILQPNILCILFCLHDLFLNLKTNVLFCYLCTFVYILVIHSPWCTEGCIIRMILKYWYFLFFTKLVHMRLPKALFYMYIFTILCE